MRVSNGFRPPYAKTGCSAYSPDGQAHLPGRRSCTLERANTSYLVTLLPAQPPTRSRGHRFHFFWRQNVVHQQLHALTRARVTVLSCHLFFNVRVDALGQANGKLLMSGMVRISDSTRTSGDFREGPINGHCIEQG